MMYSRSREFHVGCLYLMHLSTTENIPWRTKLVHFKQWVANAFPSAQLRTEHYIQDIGKNYMRRVKNTYQEKKKTSLYADSSLWKSILKILWIIWLLIRETRCTYWTQTSALLLVARVKWPPLPQLKNSCLEICLKRDAFFLKPISSFKRKMEYMDKSLKTVLKKKKKTPPNPEQRDFKHYRFTTSTLLLALLSEERKTSLK